MFYTIVVFDLMKQFVPKIYYSIGKKIQWFSFEIHLDNKFLFGGEIFNYN